MFSRNGDQSRSQVLVVIVRNGFRRSTGERACAIVFGGREIDILTVRCCDKRFKLDSGGFFDLSDVDFSLAKGEICALIGKNGSGKSTLIKSLVGILIPDRLELDYAPGMQRFSSEVAAVIEGNDGLIPKLTIFENARYFCVLRIGEFDKNFFSKLSRHLQLDNHLNSEVQKLSTGNRRKASLIVALCSKPRIAFLDEPLLGIDRSSRRLIIDLISRLAETEGMAFLISSHDLDFLEKVSSRMLLINEGRLEFSGSVLDFSRLGDSIRVSIWSDSPLPKLDETLVGEIFRQETSNSHKFYAEVSDLSELIELLHKVSGLGAKIDRLEIMQGRLESAVEERILYSE